MNIDFVVYPDQVKVDKFFNKIFKRKGDVELEIGPGYDPFILKRAKKFKNRNFFAIEIDPGRVRYLSNLIKMEKIDNVKLLYGDAKFLIPNVFLPDTFLNIFVLFPDPWPKKKHSKNRLLGYDFLLELFYVIKVGGFLTIATDHKGYAEIISSFLEKIREIEIFENVENYKDLPHTTKFQNIYLKKKKEIFVFKCKKLKNFNNFYKD